MPADEASHHAAVSHGFYEGGAMSDKADAMTDEMPEVLRPLVPTVGSVWLWEPMSPHAWCVVRVTDVIWNGEEVMVESEPLKPSALVMADGPKVWNDFSRWIEATVFYRGADGDD